jgi:hypothetical protein
VWDLLRAREDANLVERANVRAEPAMYAEHGTVDYLRQRVTVSVGVSSPHWM